MTMPSKPFTVSGILPWRVLLRAWRSDLSHQEDAAEFLHFLLQKSCPHMFEGLWESRIVTEAGLDIRLRGHWEPIRIHMPAGPCSLQACLRAWHQQADCHALVIPSDIVCLQLMRFFAQHGPVQKNMTPISFAGGESVMMPIFTEGVSVQWVAYALVAVCIHLGPTPQAGHYRALLIEGRGSRVMWYSDDNVKSRKLSPKQLESLFPDAYLFWLVRK